MPKHKKRKKKPPIKRNWIIKIFRFFFPEDWKGELIRGRVIGDKIKRGEISPKFVPTWWLGKGIRKIIDPKHQISIGKDKDKKSGG